MQARQPATTRFKSVTENLGNPGLGIKTESSRVRDHAAVRGSGGTRAAPAAVGQIHDRRFLAVPRDASYGRDGRRVGGVLERRTRRREVARSRHPAGCDADRVGRSPRPASDGGHARPASHGSLPPVDRPLSRRPHRSTSPPPAARWCSTAATPAGRIRPGPTHGGCRRGLDHVPSPVSPAYARQSGLASWWHMWL